MTVNSVQAGAARRRIKEISEEAAAVVATKATTTRGLHRKSEQLDALKAELTEMKGIVKTWDGMRQQIAALGGSAGASSPYGATSGVEFAKAGKAFGGPQIAPDEEQTKALFAAAKSKQSLGVEVKSPLGLDLPDVVMPGVVAFQREPTRIASLMPNVPMPGPSVEYVRHVSNTGAAGTVAPGGAKPEITLVTDIVTATARKIAGHVGVEDETLLDFTSSASYVTGELERALTSVENSQLLSGDGTAPNIEGLLNTSGLITRTQAASPETVLDTLELALNDLRTGSSFTGASGIVMNPADFSAARLLKNSYGEYLLGHPTDTAPPTLWGVPVVVTTDIAAKTAVVGNFAEGSQLLIRDQVRVETQSTGTDWTSNITRFRAEERVALAVLRPSMFVKVTLL